MSYYLDRVRVLSSTTGNTGGAATSIALGAAYSAAFASWLDAGGVDGRKYCYAIEDGNNVEIQLDQALASSATAIGRGTPGLSIITGTVGTAKINLTGNQQVRCIHPAEHMGVDGERTQAASVASASTTDIWNIDGDSVHVTGTTGITGFGTAAKAGLWRVVFFDGVLTLTAGSNLVLPNGVSTLTTEAGGRALIYADSTSKAVFVRYAPVTQLAAAQLIGQDKHGTDIASAATVDFSSAVGDLFDITGTTTITAVTLAEGREVVCRFTGALTFTHGSSLVLPGAVNIATAAGDFAILRGYSGGVVRCVQYQVAAVAKKGPFLKTITFNLSTIGTGNQSYTGVGFTPRAIVANGGIHADAAGDPYSSYSGFCDAARNHGVLARYLTTEVTSEALLLRMIDGTGNNHVTATVASYDSDGFTLTFTSTGSPANKTYTAHFLCFP